MKVKILRLFNGYKRFHDLTIDLGDTPKRIVALVGPNGSGKSSVLDGMIFHANAWGKLGAGYPKGPDYHSMNKVHNYSYENIQIEFITGSYSNVRQEKERTGHGNTIFSFRTAYRYNSVVKINESKAVNSIKDNSYGATVFSDLDEKMVENYRRLYIKYNKHLNDTDCTPSQAKAKIIGDLNTSIQKCLNLEVSSIGEIESSRGTLYFKKIDHSSEFEYNVLSAGEKEVIDILLDFYLRQDDYNDTVFLLDEPELHINSAIQRKLFIEINRLVGKDCQLWIATHSIGFLRALQDELKDDCQIIHFKEGTNFGSTVQILTPIKNTIANWRAILSVALDDLASSVSPKEIIYCEGKDIPGQGGKERGLDAQVYNNIFSGKYRDSLFVSSGGNTELDQRSEIAITILTKVLPSISILVLKDRDLSSGKIANENDRQVHLQNNPAHHRVLKRFEIENYLYDKEVLKRYCETIGSTFDEAEYDKFVTDITNQNLKDETGRIKNFCGIKTSVSPNSFKLTLSERVQENMACFKELEDCIFTRG